MRFFFTVTLGRGDAQAGMTSVREPRRLPVVISPEEVGRLLDAAPGLKYRAALSVAYGAGLRASEVVSLKLSDIDSERMVIRVEQGKGRKDRYVMLPPALLDLLRAWWLAARERGVMLPGGWLFPGQNPVNPLTTRQLSRTFHSLCARLLRQYGHLVGVAPNYSIFDEADRLVVLRQAAPMSPSGQRTKPLRGSLKWQPATPAHDRGHDGARVHGGHPARIHPRGQGFHGLFRPPAG